MRRIPEPQIAIVVGATDVGSAAAVALHRAGYGVVLCENADPAWPRRGMAFTDAWYVGSAELDGVAAVFCSSVRSIPTVLARGKLVAATTWSWTGVAALLAPAIVVHTRGHDRPGDDLRATGPKECVTIGVGPGFIAGAGVDVVIESAEGPTQGAILESGPASARVEVAPHLAGAGRERFVHAQVAARFVTQKCIGAVVAKEEAIGAIGAVTVRAPIAGALRGLTARGARVASGACIAEVDPRGEPALCFGIEGRPRGIAAGMLAELVRRGALAGTVRPAAWVPGELTV